MKLSAAANKTYDEAGIEPKESVAYGLAFEVYKHKGPTKNQVSPGDTMWSKRKHLIDFIYIVVFQSTDGSALDESVFDQAYVAAQAHIVSDWICCWVLRSYWVFY